MESESINVNTENNLLQWSQWQLLDSILPTGGFAHSYGLEAAIQARFVSNPEELKTYIIHVLENTGSLLLPFVYSANMFPDMETWSILDRLLEAMLTNEISRKASVSQGSALLRVAASVFVEAPAIKKMRDTLLGSGTVVFHHAPVFGLICGLLGFDSGTSQRAYMFITMRDVVSAATRLNLIGPLGAAALQHQLAHVAEQMVKKWMDRPVEQACQTAPLLDVIQGCHGNPTGPKLPPRRKRSRDTFSSGISQLVSTLDRFVDITQQNMVSNQHYMSAALALEKEEILEKKRATVMSQMSALPGLTEDDIFNVAAFMIMDTTKLEMFLSLPGNMKRDYAIQILSCR